MQILLYNELKETSITGFKKWCKLIEKDDFKSADVKKVGENLYRARLNRTARLLFSIYQYQQQNYVLVLEYLKNHDYSASRFLQGGVKIDEDKIPSITTAPKVDANLSYINPAHNRFNVLDKIISFDQSQQEVYTLNPPMIIIGSAGSGKTALTLEKMKESVGDILYVTLSPYLVKNSHDLYYGHNYENEDQQIDFFCFEEFLESIHIPQDKPSDFQHFFAWFSRQKTPIKDAHKLFEEFKGVLTGPSVEEAYLSRKAYLALGVKQSIYLADARAAVYDLFERYLQFMQQEGFYDSNILSHQYLSKVKPQYDFIVVDEVQDLTNIQLFLILQSLNNPNDFLLCGDSNQIVHPNFFSWSKVKSLFYQQKQLQHGADLIRILQTNYRNSPHVTEIANRVLRLKNARFGSIDKESNYLVKSNAHVMGDIVYLQDNDKIRKELNSKTRTSTRFAVIVMHPAQKKQAQKHFNTPLIFSIQEAKGLEYENIILYNFMSAENKRFREISKGITHEDVQREELHYSRAKDKTDKSLEVYKFYINALYVAITRAVKNLYWIEEDNQQQMLSLLGLDNALTTLDLEDKNSSLIEWQYEAQKLELQGKTEQAERIRKEILKQKTPNWIVYRDDTLEDLYNLAILQQNKKAKLSLFEYALVYNDNKLLSDLAAANFNPAKNPDNGLKLLKQKYFMPYQAKSVNMAVSQVKKFGVNFRNPFNQTPLMISAWLGNAQLIKALKEYKPNTELVDNNQHTALQIALAQATPNKHYAQKNLSMLYHILEPDSLSIQVEGRLIKLGNHLMDFMILNLLIAMFYRLIPNKLIQGKVFQAIDILEAIEHFPIDVIPQRRKKQAYISSILSNNEVNRNYRYNRKLFKRIKLGNYLFNPDLHLKIEGEWVNIYKICQLNKLSYSPKNEKRISSVKQFKQLQHNVKSNAQHLKKMLFPSE